MSVPTKRVPPIEAVLPLGRYATEPGFAAFLLGCAADGFGLDQPGDDDLTEVEWKEAVTTRVRILCGAWVMYRDRENTTGSEPSDPSTDGRRPSDD